jgi:hypothetical protein
LTLMTSRSCGSGLSDTSVLRQPPLPTPRAAWTRPSRRHGRSTASASCRARARAGLR